MYHFERYKEDISYKDVIQLDGAYATCHINYQKSPMFIDVNATTIAKKSRKNSLSMENYIDDVISNLQSFNATEQNYKKEDIIELWKNYWLEYVNAFDSLIVSLPNSIVTAFVGRHATEIGLKYIMLFKGLQVEKTHNLGTLVKKTFTEEELKADYMDCVFEFCNLYEKYIEGDNVEYFRFPEYNKNNYWCGNRLDIDWISYNLALVNLKLLHYVNL